MTTSEEFEVVLQGKANGVYDVTKYRSKTTGLEIVHAAVEGPIINGYIVLGKLTFCSLIA